MLCFVGDGIKSPLEANNVDEKPLAKNADNAPNIKGPGPKIKTRDGSKVLVTELLKSREGKIVQTRFL